MSTLLNGMQVDEPQFRRDVDRLVKGAKAGRRQARPEDQSDDGGALAARVNRG
jgi:hypothetical protein